MVLSRERNKKIITLSYNGFARGRGNCQPIVHSMTLQIVIEINYDVVSCRRMRLILGDQISHRFSRHTFYLLSLHDLW